MKTNIKIYTYIYIIYKESNHVRKPVMLKRFESYLFISSLPFTFTIYYLQKIYFMFCYTIQNTFRLQIFLQHIYIYIPTTHITFCTQAVAGLMSSFWIQCPRDLSWRLYRRLLKLFLFTLFRTFLFLILSIVLIPGM